MTTAGKIDREWYGAAQQNGSHEDIESWFSEMQNMTCEISSDLTVWTADGYDTGLWLDQDRINDICARIDAQ